MDNVSQSNTGVAEHNDSVEDDLLMLKVTNGNARSRSNSVTQKGVGQPVVSLYKDQAINSGTAALHNEYNLDLKETSAYASRSITQKADILTSAANLKISASEMKQTGTANHVKFEMRSNVSKHSKPSSKPNRKSRKSDQKSAQEKEQDEQERLEMHLPYWERKAFCSYKQIKVLQPKLDTSIEDYVKIKIDE